MEKQTCITKIKHRYNYLTNAEKKVADYILENSDKIINMPVSQLAAKSGTAKSAVIRCAKSLGFEGYSELKIALAMEISKNREFNFIPYISDDDTASDIMNKIFAADIKTLHDTMEKTDRKILSDAIEEICKGKVIYIYAIGTSAWIARELQYRLMQCGKTAICLTDVPSIKISVLNISADDIVVGISHSGRTVVTVDALEAAKKRGAKTVCITSFENSPLTKAADYPIEIYSDEIHYPIEAISSRLAHIAIIDCISIAISAKDIKNAFERSKATQSIINTVRYKNKGEQK